MAKARRFVTRREAKVERLPWGAHDWLVRTDLTDNEELVVARVSMPRGRGQPFHCYPPMETVIYVLEGRAELWVGCDSRVLEAGDVAHIPKNEVHSIRNAGSRTLRYLLILGPARFKGRAMVDMSEREPWASLLAVQRARAKGTDHPKPTRRSGTMRKEKSAARRVKASGSSNASEEQAGRTARRGSRRSISRSSKKRASG